jgi:RNA polymerase sigma-70 factor (ECF subfamily)
MQHFERELLPQVDVVVHRVEDDATFVDDVKQVLRTRLFVEPKSLAAFSGRGSLVAWLRTAAGRLALNHLRPEKRAQRAGTAELEALPFAATGPELALLKGRHQDAFRAAFARAVQSLGVRERTALKLNALDGVSLDRIAAMYGCDKSTVSRWLSKANQQLLEKTREGLSAELRLAPAELESLMLALRSQLASSLGELLASPGP